MSTLQSTKKNIKQVFGFKRYFHLAPFCGRHKVLVVQLLCYFQLTPNLYIFLSLLSSPVLSLIEAVTAHHWIANKISGDDCAFPSTEPVNALILPAIVRVLTIDLKKIFFFSIMPAKPGVWRYLPSALKHLLNTSSRSSLAFLSRLNWTRIDVTKFDFCENKDSVCLLL